MAQVMSLIFLGDYASLYLSIPNEVAPTSTDAIDFVEKYLGMSSVTGGMEIGASYQTDFRMVIAEKSRLERKVKFSILTNYFKKM